MGTQDSWSRSSFAEEGYRPLSKPGCQASGLENANDYREVLRAGMRENCKAHHMVTLPLGVNAIKFSNFKGQKLVTFVKRDSP